MDEIDEMENSGVAQLAERAVHTREVGGASPSPATGEGGDISVGAVEVAPSGMGVMLEEYAREPKGLRTWGPEMAVLLAVKGEDGLLDEVTDDLLEGCEIKSVAERMGVKVGEMSRWLFATPEREMAYRGMLRVKADLMVHETLGIGDDVDTSGENAGAAVAHAKLRIDTRLRLASKWDRKVYGEEKGAVNVGVGVKFVISQDDAGVL